eukprot:jgi/Mesvir1/8906/Mv02788-RA.1
MSLFSQRLQAAFEVANIRKGYFGAQQLTAAVLDFLLGGEARGREMLEHFYCLPLSTAHSTPHESQSSSLALCCDRAAQVAWLALRTLLEEWQPTRPRAQASGLSGANAVSAVADANSALDAAMLQVQSWLGGQIELTVPSHKLMTARGEPGGPRSPLGADDTSSRGKTLEGDWEGRRTVLEGGRVGNNPSCTGSPDDTTSDRSSYGTRSSVEPLLSRVFQAWLLNGQSFRRPGHPSTTALFRMASLCSHSCAPNASFHTHTGQLILRASRRIAPGEAVTISYLGPDQLLLPTATRAQILWEGWVFRCRCDRCLGEDRCRVLPCPACCLAAGRVDPGGALEQIHVEGEGEGRQGQGREMGGDEGGGAAGKQEMEHKEGKSKRGREERRRQHQADAPLQRRRQAGQGGEGKQEGGEEDKRVLLTGKKARGKEARRERRRDGERGRRDEERGKKRSGRRQSKRRVVEDASLARHGGREDKEGERMDEHAAVTSQCCCCEIAAVNSEDATGGREQGLMADGASLVAGKRASLQAGDLLPPGGLSRSLARELAGKRPWLCARCGHLADDDWLREQLDDEALVMWRVLPALERVWVHGGELGSGGSGSGGDAGADGVVSSGGGSGAACMDANAGICRTLKSPSKLEVNGRAHSDVSAPRHFPCVAPQGLREDLVRDVASEGGQSLREDPGYGEKDRKHRRSARHAPQREARAQEGELDGKERVMHNAASHTRIGEALALQWDHLEAAVWQVCCSALGRSPGIERVKALPNLAGMSQGMAMSSSDTLSSDTSNNREMRRGRARLVAARERLLRLAIDVMTDGADVSGVVAGICHDVTAANDVIRTGGDEGCTAGRATETCAELAGATDMPPVKHRPARVRWDDVPSASLATQETMGADKPIHAHGPDRCPERELLGPTGCRVEAPMKTNLTARVWHPDEIRAVLADIACLMGRGHVAWAQAVRMSAEGYYRHGVAACDERSTLAGLGQEMLFFRWSHRHAPDVPGAVAGHAVQVVHEILELPRRIPGLTAAAVRLAYRYSSVLAAEWGSEDETVQRLANLAEAHCPSCGLIRVR